MGFGPIQFGGLASGLDTGAIISAILQLERRPVFILEGQKESEEGKLSLLSTFENLVRDLQNRATELQAGNSFYAYELTVGTEGVATFTTTGGATPGAHELEVFSLARADRWAWDGLPDSDTTGLGSGTISFDYNGTTHPITITAGVNDTLDGIAAEINSVAGADVTATVINTGTEASPSYQLALSGDDTGRDFAIQNLTVTGVGLTGQDNIVRATNAEVVIDGLMVQRSTNVFADVLPGVSFTVTDDGDGAANPATTSFTIDTDLEGVKENVRGFVDAYNAVIEFINGQNEFDVEEETSGGALFGDSALRSVRSALTQSLFGSDRDDIVRGTSTTSPFALGFESLGFVGITQQGDGTLSIDDTALDAKLTEDLDAFVDLFTFDFVSTSPAIDHENDGILLRLDKVLDDLLEDRSITDPSDPSQTISLDGLFNNRRNAVNALIRDIDDQIERIEFQLERREEALVQQFSNLERIMAGLQSQQAFLSSGQAFPTF